MDKHALYTDNLDDLFNGDQDLTIKACQSFLKHIGNYTAMLIDARVNKNGPELKRIAHSLKSSFRLFGDWDAQKTAMELERIGQENDWDNSEAVVKKLCELSEAATATLEMIIHSKTK